MKIVKENIVIFNLKKRIKKEQINNLNKIIWEWMVKVEVKKSMKINFSKMNIF